MGDSWYRHPTSLLTAGALAVSGGLFIAIGPAWAVYSGAALLGAGALLGGRAWAAVRHQVRQQSDDQTLLQLLAEASSDLVCQHADDGTYCWVSPSASRILGRQAKGMIGTHPRDVVDPADAARFSGQSPSGTFRHLVRRPDGTQVTLETVLAPLSSGFRSVSRDISRELADADALAQARQAAAMAERMAAIGTLAGGVAHEFNNLNAVILGNVELAMRHGGLPPEARIRLEHIREAVDRERCIVDALLAFSRTERGPGSLIDLGSIASTTAALAQRTLRQRQVTLGLELPDERLFARVPGGSLGQVLLNLLLNACDAVDRRHDPRVWIRLHQAGGRGLLTVRDNGVGIRPEELPRIFEPFFSTKGEHAARPDGQPWLKGSGLGLSVCRTLVDQMDGTITVDSAPDAGSTFTVSLPLAPAPPAAADGATHPTPCARVLVVDDEPEIRRLLAEHLAVAGHVAVEAEDGRRALDRLAREDVDLILLNWNMPELDGQAFLEHLELHPERRWPPVVVVSGWSGGGSGIERWRREIAAELPKPFSMEQVRSTVQDVLLGTGGIRIRPEDDSAQRG